MHFDLPSDVAPSVLVAIFYLISVIALLFTLRFSYFGLGFGIRFVCRRRALVVFNQATGEP